MLTAVDTVMSVALSPTVARSGPSMVVSTAWNAASVRQAVTQRNPDPPGPEDLWHFCRPDNDVTICHVRVRTRVLVPLRGRASEEA